MQLQNDSGQDASKCQGIRYGKWTTLRYCFPEIWAINVLRGDPRQVAVKVGVKDSRNATTVDSL